MQTKAWHALPGMVVAFAGVALLAWGPIPQLPHYHDFADTRGFAGIPNAWNGLSNVLFAAVGAWRLGRPHGAVDAPQLPAERMFHLALLLTAAGSAYYHWAPDN